MSTTTSTTKFYVNKTEHRKKYGKTFRITYSFDYSEENAKLQPVFGDAILINEEDEVVSRVHFHGDDSDFMDDYELSGELLFLISNHVVNGNFTDNEISATPIPL